MLLCCFVFLVFVIPPLRNLVLWPVWPLTWRYLSSWEVGTVVYNGVAGRHLGILRPCTDPKEKGQMTTPRIDYDSAQARDRDVHMFDRARTHLDSRPPEQARRLTPYLPIMSLTDKARLLVLWRVLDDALRRWNVTYFLIEGSLLGAIRHHGVIPWDDDMDIAVWEQDVEPLQRALSCLDGYALRVQDNFHYKFFNDRASIVPVMPAPLTLHAQQLSEKEKKEGQGPMSLEKIENIVMRYPFVDIFIVRTLGEITSALTHYSTSTTAFHTEDILPLTVQEFEGYLIPVPARSKKILWIMYNFSECLSPFHNHRVGVGLQNSTSIRCSELRGMYPIYGL